MVWNDEIENKLNLQLQTHKKVDLSCIDYQLHHFTRVNSIAIQLMSIGCQVIEGSVALPLCWDGT